MDIQTLLHNLHEEVCCSVCMSKFTDPKQLPCLHNFCLQCLSGIQRTSGFRDKIECPECRKTARIPGNGNLNALPTNFKINSLLDVLAIKECDTRAVKCGNCEKKSDKSCYCFQCCSFWCDECSVSIMRVSQGGSLFPCSLPKLPYVPMFPHFLLICSLFLHICLPPTPALNSLPEKTKTKTKQKKTQMTKKKNKKQHSLVNYYM